MDSSKKMAVCLSGHPRTFENTAKNFKELFGDAVDFYFSTWASYEVFGLEETFKKNGLNLVGYEYVAEPDNSRSERFILEKFKDTFPDFFIFNQWFGVKRVLRLMKDHEAVIGQKYDVVFRARFDLSFQSSLKSILDKSNESSINYIEATSKGSDQFLFSSRDNMLIFTQFEDWLRNYPEKYGTAFGFFASPLVKAFILDSGLSINKVDEKMTVVRESSGSARLKREKRSREYIAKVFPDLSGIVWNGERSVGGLTTPAPWDRSYYTNANELFLFNGAKLK